MQVNRLEHYINCRRTIEEMKERYMGDIEIDFSLTYDLQHHLSKVKETLDEIIDGIDKGSVGDRQHD